MYQRKSSNNTYDPRFDTVPLHVQQPVNPYQPPYAPPPKRRGLSCTGCLTGMMVIGLAFFVLLAAYFLAPLRTNLLVLGIDRAPEGTTAGRSDTMILLSVVPLRPDVSMLSIPRDLWVSIPNVGENRINTAHFFAEAEQPGSGPAAAVEVVEQNFDVDVPYYVRVRFDAFQYIVDALGGVTVNLPEPMAGRPAGTQTLDGPAALAFVRDRQGTDDFYRMAHTQFLVKAIARQVISPESWPRLPAVVAAGAQSVDTNLPFWHMPRIGLAMLRAILSDSIDSRTIQREMVEPFVTEGGAQVLLPRWDRITPLMNEMFNN